MKKAFYLLAFMPFLALTGANKGACITCQEETRRRPMEVPLPVNDKIDSLKSAIDSLHEVQEAIKRDVDSLENRTLHLGRVDVVYWPNGLKYVWRWYYNRWGQYVKTKKDTVK